MIKSLFENVPNRGTSYWVKGMIGNMVEIWQTFDPMHDAPSGMYEHWPSPEKSYVCYLPAEDVIEYTVSGEDVLIAGGVSIPPAPRLLDKSRQVAQYLDAKKLGLID